MMAKGWRRYRNRRVMVNLKTGDGISGLVVRADGDLLVLVGGQLYKLNAPVVKLDGETLIDLREVAYAQAVHLGERLVDPSGGG